MTGGSGTLVCPKGHTSSESDYCSECGARIAASAGGPPSTPAPDTAGRDASAQVCPDCGTLREQTGIAFCEVCGFNFNTGAHGELNLAASAAPAPLIPPPASQPEPAPEPEPPVDVIPLPVEVTPQSPARWTVLVAVDPGLGSTESPQPPSTFVPFTVDLDRPVSLVGRTNEARAIFPEIALPLDEAVSRRHALLQRSDDGALTLRDIGSANGTRLNGREVAAMVDTPLKPGDEITLGHWTRLTVGPSA